MGHSGWHIISIVEGVGVLVGIMVVVKVSKPVGADAMAVGMATVVVNVDRSIVGSGGYFGGKRKLFC